MYHFRLGIPLESIDYNFIYIETVEVDRIFGTYIFFHLNNNKKTGEKNGGD